MESAYHGRPPTRRRALGDGTNRANEIPRTQRRDEKHNNDHAPSSATQQLPHNESIVPNGTLAVRHEQASPENKRLSAVQAHEGRPHNSKRDSEISNASTNASISNRRRKTHIGPWQLGRTIGRGGCSRVRLVRHSGTGQYGAAKIISKATAEKVRALSLANLIQSAEQDGSLYSDGKAIPFGLEREICIMKLLDHPNIVRLYDIWENRDELYLIMEFVEGGELFSYIHEQGGLIEIHTVHIFRQIIAALKYCHRINIHHRDLKPENILLDRDTMTVKLVDFGMAALQPEGKKLTTPCGSPHYAAPEVIKTISYDGAKADVWSCGVILFVLLTGTPPFNYSGDDRHLKHLFRDIAEAKYTMPDNISREAQDLIKRILVADPKRRISLEEIWDHPFLRKYQQELNFLGENTKLDHWTGPFPGVEDWTNLERTAIDREILRYLRTLWHSEKEEALIQKLMSNEANYEKYFYSALRKYHTDQLENYQPSAHHAVAHSNSDYHHNTRHPPTQLDVEELPSKLHSRSQSAYSILNNEHLYSKHSLYESPVSEASYDPYRASRQPIIPIPEDTELHQNVTVHRGYSSRSDKLRPTTALGHRTGSSLRIQALRNNSKRSSALSRGSSNRSSPSRRNISVQRRSVSRSSLASSHWPSSPPVIARSSGMGKRGVSFSHLRDRRSSAATTSSWQTEVGSCADYMSHRPHTSIGSYGPSMKTGTVRSNPKSRIPLISEATRLKIRKHESPTKYIQCEARKVSVELGKVMEEAFNRSSVGSSIRSGTDAYHDTSQYDSPPTSFSNTRDSGGSTMGATPGTKMMFGERPLPPIPSETPNTFLQRKLAETREEIARRLNENDDNTEQFNEVLEHLDRLMVPTVNGGKRAVSAPAKSPEHGPLHVIPEEVKNDHGDGFELHVPHRRVVTDPVRPQGRRVAIEHQQTIRLVDESPTRIAPLNIRKRSGASSKSTKTTDEASAVTWPGPISNSTVRPYQNVQSDLLAARTYDAPPAPEKQIAVIKKKKSLWFRRNTEEKERDQDNKENQIKKKLSNGLLRIPDAWQGLDDRIKNEPEPFEDVDNTKHNEKQSEGSSGSEFPLRNTNSVGAKGDGMARKAFFAFFGKKSKEEKAKRSMELGAMNHSSSSILSNFDLGAESSTDIVRTGPPEMQMNWLSRFLHIKPANKTLCFQIGRGKVRQDLVRLLRDWQRFGVHDVSLDREANSISARIDKSNHLKIKPVSFVIELFVVLEHGRRANLCLARFTQTRGAASSFRKVVDIVEDVCRARCMLVEDEQKKASMMEVLD
ncbi:Serine/threonine-protein kinase GIN4 [Pyrenophora tritici-repentis]|nr:Serine/threonine-protein kinase GIN4 [Pyrenophora tritici-repentis]KAI0615570.1 Serine/threonine-protein kinase GIN4 [Pyrenophora tritici-repentis]KAI0627944.1 Serine/threonine-protein kinase GIN4 [Pyrenophora tritici-repentis]KAI2484192.1 Serine/threonine-protein kinase GIN4 [Pyrenophora tritici-repentis]